MTPIEARELVERSGIIIVLGWDIERAFVLEQIKRQDKEINFEATSSDGLKRGSSFNIDTKTLAIWSIAPETNKPKMMDVEETTQGKMLTWTLDNTTGKEVSNMMKHLALMNEAKMDQIEDRLATSYNEFLETRKLYEEELKTSYVQK